MMTVLNLKGRLRLIAEKIPHCHTLYDIGTDHAYVPIYAVRNGLCSRAVALDIKTGPVAAAEKNVRSFGLSDAVETRQGDGFYGIEPGKEDAVVIAGMGGVLIVGLLNDGHAAAVSAGTLILQPMYAVSDVRRWLYGGGFDIIDEELAAEGEKIYNVLVARYDGAARDTGEIEVLSGIGKKLVEKKDPLLGKLITKRIDRLEKIAAGMGASARYAGCACTEDMRRIRSMIDDMKKMRDGI